MPEYVYGLHDFTPENEDEVPFRAGERIEVVEKDDEYGDGWWHGRNTAGKTGLFPQSYTTSTPPSDSVGIATRSTLASSSSATPETIPPSEKTPTSTPAILLNGNKTDGEVMKATMTDVQQAIEQLGGGRGDGDDGSFSFASSRGGADTENDTDTDADSELNAEEGGQGWHKNARRKLAEKARQAIADAERLEMIGLSSNRSYMPPIQVELSDESEDDEDDEHYPTSAASYPRRHSRIPEEEDEEERTTPPAHHDDGKVSADRGSEYSANVSLPETESDDLQTAIATRNSFLAQTHTPPPETPTSTSLAQAASVPMPQSPPESRRTSTPLMDTFSSLPSPLLATDVMARQQQTRADSNGSTSAAPSTAPSSHILESSTSTATTVSSASTLSVSVEKKEKTNPSDWAVEDVVDWLKSKGFDQDVCAKFIEQEITGDVLLELDVNLLKSEIGIMAFGKRMRIANAITDLRRPPSITYSDRQESTSSAILSGNSGNLFDSPTSLQNSSISPQGHSRTVSQSQSQHSYPSSYNGMNAFLSPESADSPSPGAPTMVESSSWGGEGVGLGLGPTGSSGTITQKSRPSQLSLSPSEGALGATVRAIGVPDEAEEDRAALSEGEPGRNSSMRRRIFGRSHDSTSSRHSTKDSISPTSPNYVEFEKPKEDKEKKQAAHEKEPSTVRHGRTKKSVDVGKSSDRLSLFGGSFGGTIGKHRKPPPKYSGDDLSLNEKSSSFHMPKLAGRKSGGRPSTGTAVSYKAANSIKEKEIKDKDRDSKSTKDDGEKSPHLLRKRTASYPGPSSAPMAAPVDGAVVSPLKSGQNIFEQIGQADHSGWMRKRGERYNSWKLRYFLLKGPHLYIMKSDSSTQTKIKGYVNIIGYRVTVDENLNPGKYGFRIEHEQDKMHFFSSDDKAVIREWMKAIMKATIARDYTQPVISSVNIPTIPLMVAQAMNPAPRPPSPNQREALQKALRRENPNQLSSRDARVLMGLSSGSDEKDDKANIETFFTNQPEAAASFMESPRSARSSIVPPRPSRRKNSTVSVSTSAPVDDELVRWANSHLPSALSITDTSGSICGALQLLRIAESVKGRPSSPPVPDSAFPTDQNDEKLDGLFKLFDFLLDNEVKMGAVSINDVKQGNREKVIQVLKALKAWEEKRKALAQSIGKGSVSAGSFIAPALSPVGEPWHAL